MYHTIIHVSCCKIGNKVSKIEEQSDIHASIQYYLLLFELHTYMHFYDE